jgi:hypothetical protein
MRKKQDPQKDVLLWFNGFTLGIVIGIISVIVLAFFVL